MTVFARKSSSHASLHSWQPQMSCICFTDGDCDENRIFLAPVTVVATAANTATAGGSLELPECSDLVLGGYLA